MSENFLGEIRMFGGNFAPKGWALCQGQLLPISQNSALYSLIGTTFGGDGSTTFALPNLQGRLPVGQGMGPGLSNRVIGESSGSETVSLATATMPAHNHPLYASSTASTQAQIGTGVLTGVPTGSGAVLYATVADNPTIESLPPDSVSMTGSGVAHDNLMPSLCITFIIALFGVFPSRN